MKKTLVAAIAAGAAAVLMTASPASASASGFGNSTLRKEQVVTYTTSRTVTAAGTNIYVQKTDGPALDVRWYKCSDRNVYGAWFRLQNADPTPRVRIGTNFKAGTSFCLQALSHGSNATDTWSGTVWWNVSS